MIKPQSFVALMAAMDMGDGIPQWLHLIPAGELQTVDGRDGFHWDGGDLQLLSFDGRQSAPRVPVDVNHANAKLGSDGHETPAKGWIVELQTRDDGVWGRVEWNDSGRALISDKAYRGISAELMVRQPDGEIVGIRGASLTNMPNLKGLQPIFNAAEPAPTENMPMETLIVELRKILGLPEGADEKAILAQLRESFGSDKSATPDPSKFVPISEFERVVAENNRLNQGVALQSASSHVEAQIASGKMPSYLREWGVSLCTVNKPAFDTFIDRTKKMFVNLTQEVATPGRLRRPGADGAVLTEEERDAAVRMGLTDEEFLKGKPARH